MNSERNSLLGNYNYAGVGIAVNPSNNYHYFTEILVYAETSNTSIIKSIQPSRAQNSNINFSTALDLNPIQLRAFDLVFFN